MRWDAPDHRSPRGRESQPVGRAGTAARRRGGGARHRHDRSERWQAHAPAGARGWRPRPVLHDLRAARESGPLPLALEAGSRRASRPAHCGRVPPMSRPAPGGWILRVGPIRADDGSASHTLAPVRVRYDVGIVALPGRSSRRRGADPGTLSDAVRARARGRPPSSGWLGAALSVRREGPEVRSVVVLTATGDPQEPGFLGWQSRSRILSSALVAANAEFAEDFVQRRVRLSHLLGTGAPKLEQVLEVLEALLKSEELLVRQNGELRAAVAPENFGMEIRRGRSTSAHRLCSDGGRGERSPLRPPRRIVLEGHPREACIQGGTPSTGRRRPRGRFRGAPAFVGHDERLPDRWPAGPSGLSVRSRHGTSGPPAPERRVRAETVPDDAGPAKRLHARRSPNGSSRASADSIAEEAVWPRPQIEASRIA